MISIDICFGVAGEFIVKRNRHIFGEPERNPRNKYSHDRTADASWRNAIGRDGLNMVTAKWWKRKTLSLFRRNLLLYWDRSGTTHDYLGRISLESIFGWCCHKRIWHDLTPNCSTWRCQWSPACMTCMTETNEHHLPNHYWKGYPSEDSGSHWRRLINKFSPRTLNTCDLLPSLMATFETLAGDPIFNHPSEQMLCKSPSCWVPSSICAGKKRRENSPHGVSNWSPVATVPKANRSKLRNHGITAPGVGEDHEAPEAVAANRSHWTPGEGWAQLSSAGSGRSILAAL